MRNNQYRLLGQNVASVANGRTLALTLITHQSPILTFRLFFKGNRRHKQVVFTNFYLLLGAPSNRGPLFYTVVCFITMAST